LEEREGENQEAAATRKNGKKDKPELEDPKGLVPSGFPSRLRREPASSAKK